MLQNWSLTGLGAFQHPIWIPSVSSRGVKPHGLGLNSYFSIVTK